MSSMERPRATSAEGALCSASINYDDVPIAELEVEGIPYRLDADRGSTVAISRSAPGSWDWTPVAEGRWDGSRLRARGLDRPVVVALAAALAEAMRNRQGLES